MEDSNHSDKLEHLLATRKTGDESFKLANEITGIALLEFWQWSVSDLASNATRGRLAEFIIASALGLATGSAPNGTPLISSRPPRYGLR